MLHCHALPGRDLHETTHLCNEWWLQYNRIFCIDCTNTTLGPIIVQCPSYCQSGGRNMSVDPVAIQYNANLLHSNMFCIFYIRCVVCSEHTNSLINSIILRSTARWPVFLACIYPRNWSNPSHLWIIISGGTLRQDICQLIGLSLIVLARQAQKNRN